MSISVQAASKPEGAAQASQTASQRSSAANASFLRTTRLPTHPHPVSIDPPSDQPHQQADRGGQGAAGQGSQARAPGTVHKLARNKLGQPKDASLTALARAPDTLQEPSKIGVRMPGDPPR